MHMNKKKNTQPKKNKKLKKNVDDDCTGYSSDETFAFIAGYTEGGVPYGITWDEWGELEKKDPNSADVEKDTCINDEDLPF